MVIFFLIKFICDSSEFDLCIIFFRYKCICREWIVRKKMICIILEMNMEGNEMMKKKN